MAGYIQDNHCAEVTVPCADDELLAEIVGRLVLAYDPLFVYLFGSRARGDAGPDSDYDIMLVVPNDAPEPQRLSTLAYQVLWGLKEAGDILVWTQARFDKSSHLRSSLSGTVLREGRLLHAA
jgi:predicted nucleotidyltransferase